jgi:hypothetical protein
MNTDQLYSQSPEAQRQQAEERRETAEGMRRRAEEQRGSAEDTRQREEQSRQYAGGVLDLDLTALDRQAEFISINKQPNDDVVHLDRFRKADRLAHQTLDTCT